MKWRQISTGTSLHGFRFLVKGSPLQRVFWFLSICLSAFCMIYFILSTIEGFQREPVATNLETDNILWNNTFPSVSICLVRGRRSTKVQLWLQDYWKRMNLPTSFKPISFNRLALQYLFVTHNNIVDGGDINDELCLQYKDYEVCFNLKKSLLMKSSVCRLLRN